MAVLVNALLVLRAGLLSAGALSDVRSAWLLVMGVVFSLIAAGFFLRVAARRVELWLEPRVRAWVALSRAQADRNHGQLPAAGGVRV